MSTVIAIVLRLAVAVVPALLGAAVPQDPEVVKARAVSAGKARWWRARRALYLAEKRLAPAKRRLTIHKALARHAEFLERLGEDLAGMEAEFLKAAKDLK